MSRNSPTVVCLHAAPCVFNFFISHGWTLGHSWEFIIKQMLRLHVHKHSWRHKFGDKAFDRHICPCQLSQHLVEAKPDITKDLKVSKAFALETIRNQERVSYIEMRFLELICFNVTQYPTVVCQHAAPCVFNCFISTDGHLDNHGD